MLIDTNEVTEIPVLNELIIEESSDDTEITA